MIEIDSLIRTDRTKFRDVLMFSFKVLTKRIITLYTFFITFPLLALVNNLTIS